MHFSSQLRERRESMGFTQAEAALKAGLSLPFLQLIEGSQANPSLRNVESLCRALGLVIEIRAVEPDWVALAAMGVPLSSRPPRLAWRHEASERELRLAHSFCRQTLGFNREREAIEAYLMALRDHFPSRYRVFRKLELPKVVSGRHIKLKRISVAALGELF